jgi:cyclopropane-fatty-acyl-phospholipid synthase
MEAAIKRASSEELGATGSGLGTNNPSVLERLPRAVRARFMREGIVGLGEDYIAGRWETPDLAGFLAEFVDLPEVRRHKFSVRTLGYVLRAVCTNPQSGRGVFEVGERHYDLGNTLFSAMLDDSMSYTSGIWTGATTLAEAQEEKLRRICEKLDLKPGMTVLDIGCGWGNFARYAATHYRVKVIGLTISREQQALGRERCAGLPVDIRLQDYREFNERVDRVVSIEMIEAVGHKNLRAFFEAAHRALVPGGRFVLQVISGNSFTLRSPAFLDQYLLWLVRHIFPNGYLPRLDHLTGREVEPFLLESMEGFGESYDRTLQAWRANFDAAWGSLKGRYDERFRRMWHFYLCGCMACFRRRLVNVYQIVYRRVDS